MNTIREPTSGRSWATARELIDHIGATHHGYLRLTLPVLDRLSEQIACEKLVPITLTDRFERKFTALADLLETHIAKQECWLFPKIRELREPVGETAWACRMGDSLEELMDRLTRDNQDALALLQQIETCLTDARWTGKGPLVDQLVEDIRELHENFVQHARLESDVLFRHVRELLQAQTLAV
jgi:iron-sulfur cluster repair protein YtfE (RIC family)